MSVGAKCDAKANGNPRVAASCAPKKLDPSNPDRYTQTCAGDRADFLPWLRGFEVRL